MGIYPKDPGRTWPHGPPKLRTVIPQKTREPRSGKLITAEGVHPSGTCGFSSLSPCACAFLHSLNDQWSRPRKHKEATLGHLYIIAWLKHLTSPHAWSPVSKFTRTECFPVQCSHAFAPHRVKESRWGNMNMAAWECLFIIFFCIRWCHDLREVFPPTQNVPLALVFPLLILHHYFSAFNFELLFFFFFFH